MICAPVTVIIPCYKCESTIDRAVNSVFNQSLRPKEVILVNDCENIETKRALQIIQEKYGKDWLRIVPFTTNEGPAGARNKGWDIATQDFIAFLDADDAWDSTKIEVQWGWMDENPKYSLTGHHYKIVDSESFKKVTPSTKSFYDISKSALLLRNRFGTSSVMLRKDIPERFDQSRRYAEDYLLWLTISQSGKLCALSSETLGFRFNQAFGDSGLSENLYMMSKGEAGNYLILRRAGLMSFSQAFLLIVWSFIKSARRWALATKVVRKKMSKKK